MKYTNTQQFNLGLKFMTSDPADDRLVLSSSANMFVNKNNTANSSLFNRAYAGMVVTVEDEGYETYVCIDDSPYKAKTVANVTAANLKNYWKRGDQTLYNYVHTEVDDYVRTPHIKVNSQWITCTSTLSSTGIKGIDYVFDASVDNDTLKVKNHILSGWKFQLKRVESPATTNYSEYNLQYWQPGATQWADDPVKIEIPKVQVVKQVKLCKAVADASELGGYRVIVYRDECTEQEWEDAEGSVFLRVEWDNDNTPPATAVTYINVAEIITIDIEPLRIRLTSLESSTFALETSVNLLEGRAAVVDGSIASLHADDASIVNYVNGKVTEINENIRDNYYELSSSIGQTRRDINERIDVIVGGAVENLSETLNVMNASISDISTRVAGNFSSLSSSIGDTYNILSASIGETYTSLNDVIVNEVTTAIDRVNLEILDVSGRVAANRAIADASLRALDASYIELYNHNIEITNVWAAAWNALFEANPNLHKPGEEPVGGQGIYYDTIDTSIGLNETDIKTLQYYDNATNVYTGIMTNKRYCYLAIPEGKTFTMVTSNTEPIQDDFQLIGTTNIDSAAFTLYCLDQYDLPMDDVTSTITVI